MRTQTTLKALLAAAVLGASALTASAGPAVFNGSGLSTTVNVQAGDTVTFQYDLLTSSNTANPQDFAFYTLGGNAFLIKSQNQATNPSSDFFVPGFQTGTTPSFMGDPTPNAPYHLFTTVTATSTGPLTFGVGVVNVGDSTVGTAVALDDIRLVHGGVSTQLNGTNSSTAPNNGGFENPDADTPNHNQDLFPYTVAGNVVLASSGTFGQINPSEGGFFAFLSNTAASTTGGSNEPTDLNTLAAALGTTGAQIQAVSDAVNPSATTVPLPTGLMIAPLGLALAGAFVVRARRAAAC